MTAGCISKKYVNKIKKCWQRCRFVVIYTSLSLRYSKAKPWSWTLAEVALKEAIKNISKSSWQKELNEVLYKSWLTQRTYKNQIKILQSWWESSVPWKLNNANRKSCTHDFKPDVGITLCDYFIQDLCKTNLNSFIRIIQITRANRFFNKFIGEFDPGSGRTLAACLTHASRTGWHANTELFSVRRQRCRSFAKQNRLRISKSANTT